jgi:hypothetical protein
LYSSCSVNFFPLQISSPPRGIRGRIQERLLSGGVAVATGNGGGGGTASGIVSTTGDGTNPGGAVSLVNSLGKASGTGTGGGTGNGSASLVNESGAATALGNGGAESTVTAVTTGKEGSYSFVYGNGLANAGGTGRASFFSAPLEPPQAEGGGNGYSFVRVGGVGFFNNVDQDAEAKITGEGISPGAAGYGSGSVTLSETPDDGTTGDGTMGDGTTVTTDPVVDTVGGGGGASSDGQGGVNGVAEGQGTGGAVGDGGGNAQGGGGGGLADSQYLALPAYGP